jgi:hypothetical protein
VAIAREAIVVRTGRAVESDLICHYLRDSSVSVVECRDAIDACLHILRNPEAAPQIAFIGADWLAREEFALAGYMHQAWPGILIVLHGDGADKAPIEHGRGAIVCATTAELSQLLSSPLDEVLVEGRLTAAASPLRYSARQSVPRSPVLGAAVEPCRPVEYHCDASVRAPADLELHTEPARMPASGLHDSALSPSLDWPCESPRTILTQEELESLLRDSGV